MRSDAVHRQPPDPGIADACQRRSTGHAGIAAVSSRELDEQAGSVRASGCSGRISNGTNKTGDGSGGDRSCHRSRCALWLRLSGRRLWAERAVPPGAHSSQTCLGSRRHAQCARPAAKSRVSQLSRHIAPQWRFVFLAQERVRRSLALIVIAAARFEVGVHGQELVTTDPKGSASEVCVKSERRSRPLSRHRTARDRPKSRCPETARGVRRHGRCAGQPLRSPGHALRGRHGRLTAPGNRRKIHR